jgi:hypothetical protein
MTDDRPMTAASTRAPEPEATHRRSRGLIALGFITVAVLMLVAAYLLRVNLISSCDAGPSAGTGAGLAFMWAFLALFPAVALGVAVSLLPERGASWLAFLMGMAVIVWVYLALTSPGAGYTTEACPARGVPGWWPWWLPN